LILILPLLIFRVLIAAPLQLPLPLSLLLAFVAIFDFAFFR
jgi:hypothetical protein